MSLSERSADPDYRGRRNWTIREGLQRSHGYFLSTSTVQYVNPGIFYPLLVRLEQILTLNALKEKYFISAPISMAF